MITFKKTSIVYTMRTLCLGTFMGVASLACVAESSISVRHLVSEQNILSIKEAKKYLLLPVQDKPARRWITMCRSTCRHT